MSTPTELKVDAGASAGAAAPPQPRAPPPSWHSLPCVIGVDEAGRGPVLGPMVYGAAWAPLEDKDAALKGVDDSKKLAEGERDRLYEILEKAPRVGFRVESLSAAQISSAMLGKRNKTSLNALAFDATRDLIQGALDSGVNVASAFVDTVGDAGRWRDKLLEVFPFIEFTVCPKADALYPIVSAASIVAKVTRDRDIEELQRGLGARKAAEAAAEKEKESGGRGRESGSEKACAPAAQVSIGSGYPGDPATKSFLESSKHPLFGWGEHVRFSWSTAARALAVEHGAVAVEWEDDDEDGGGDGESRNRSSSAAAGRKRNGGGGTAQQGIQGRISFGGGPAQPVSGASTGAGRASYFRARRLQLAAL